MEGMNIKPATKNPKATEEIGGMLDMIQTLIDKGHAYPAADGTYISGPEASRTTASCLTRTWTICRAVTVPC